LPRRNPDVPRPSLRERYTALKGSAAKVIRRKAPPASAPEPAEAETAAPVRVHVDDATPGLMTFADASGALHTKPFAEGVAFMAARLYSIARNEHGRRFNAECGDLDAAGCEALDARLRRELRLDALHILAFRFEQAFAEGQAKRDGANPARLAAEKVDLKALDVGQLANLYEAFQVAKHGWEGAVMRPYSSAARDPGRGCIHLTKAGEQASFEEERAGFIVDRIVEEMARRTPQTKHDRDWSLLVRLQHELNCEDRIRDQGLMREITQAWGA
ncbi:hypothetical protein CS379_21395, partial [Methylobacterium frigidaeris]